MRGYTREGYTREKAKVDGPHRQRWPDEDDRRTVQMVHIVSENINRQTGLTLVLAVMLTVAIGLLYPVVAGLFAR
jgi:hypothetical protein